MHLVLCIMRLDIVHALSTFFFNGEIELPRIEYLGRPKIISNKNLTRAKPSMNNREFLSHETIKYRGLIGNTRFYMNKRAVDNPIDVSLSTIHISPTPRLYCTCI